MTADPNTDAQNNKVYAILAYIIFFIPMIAAKDSKFAMYHANQGLTLFLLYLACQIVFRIIPFLGWVLIPLAGLFCLALAIIGIINAANGEMKPLPLIGQYTLLM
ncbi:DUF4870 domain-containing protein [Paenibacillus sp. HJGM_3]|uniref:DUF4870 domain-containing protein n=1 Tax=Paenibacillus sp. HJGM_3 TaxID=3379816 RepID=UPI00385C09DE